LTLSVDDPILTAKLTDMKKSLAKEIDQRIMSECVQSKLLQLPENYRAPCFSICMATPIRKRPIFLAVLWKMQRSRLHRARKKIREILTGDCEMYVDERSVLC